MNLQQLRHLFLQAGCTSLHAKILAENDNSKNQVYFGPNFQVLNILPIQDVVADSSKAKPIFKARCTFGWLQENGSVCDAPHAQFILYPQYPEVRFSGFLRGCASAPVALMTPRIAGRVLFLGVAGDRIMGHVVATESEAASETRALGATQPGTLFLQVGISLADSEQQSRARLLEELKRIHLLGWIESKQLSTDGSLRPCDAPQCGGFTLEAELGISKNSRAEPDFLGWEVKQHAVSRFDRLSTGRITLMTPEPTGGVYKEGGPEEFVRRFGYSDTTGRPDRRNFGGVHRVSERQPSTHLTLTLIGFDMDSGRITDPSGCIALVTESREVAASWNFSGLMKHWNRKHSKAAYVPARCLKEPIRQYSFGPTVRLGLRTEFPLFLRAMGSGLVYYDPGIKVEHLSTRPVVKRRNQFRIGSRDLGALYEAFELVTL